MLIRSMCAAFELSVYFEASRSQETLVTDIKIVDVMKLRDLH